MGSILGYSRTTTNIYNRETKTETETRRLIFIGDGIVVQCCAKLNFQIAATAGLDAEAARTQMLAPDVVAILNQDRADVETVGIRQTPTFFVNGKPLDPFGEAELRRLVAAEVAAA